MAMQYISHANNTERLARIQRVQMSIEENKQRDAIKSPVITEDLDKGKGHVFGFNAEVNRLQRKSLVDNKPLASAPDHDLPRELEEEHSPSCSFTSPSTSKGSTVFRMGSILKTSSSGIPRGRKSERRRPPAWKRRSRKAQSISIVDSPKVKSKASMDVVCKRKSEITHSTQPNKSPKTQENTVASIVKPLQSQ